MNLINVNDKLPKHKERVLLLIRYKNMYFFPEQDNMRFVEGYVKFYSKDEYIFIAPHGMYDDVGYPKFEVLAWCDRPSIPNEYF